MSVNSVLYLRQISNYLQVPINKITEDEDKLPTCTILNKPITGFINIIVSIVSQSQSPMMMGTNLFEQAQIRQWLQYCVTYGFYCNNQILSELNKILAKKTYFVGNNLTIADVALFYVLQNFFQKMSYLEKETYLNVSRWFDNIQQNQAIRKDKPIIDFSTIFLSLTLR